jgi:hypothetical protein
MSSAMKYPTNHYPFIAQAAKKASTDNRSTTTALNEDFSKWVIANSIIYILKDRFAFGWK